MAKKRVTKKMIADLNWARRQRDKYQKMVELIEEVIVTSTYLDLQDEKAQQMLAPDGAKEKNGH
jgi:hypothetical protein